MLDYSYIVVSALLSLIVTTVTMLIVSKRIIYPSMIAIFEEKYATAEGAIKKGFSALGTRSAQVRKEKAMSKEITEHVLEEYPEILAVAERISPDLVEMIEEDPETALRLVDRYLPLLKKFFPDLLAEYDKEGQSKLSWEF